MSNYVISTMTLENMNDYDLENQTFLIIGRIIPKLENGIWSHQEEIFEQTYLSKYPEDEGLEECISSDDNIAFLYYVEGKCMGHIRLSILPHMKFVSIDRLIVSENFRGNGIGTTLLNKAREWAIEQGMKGFTLETQDTNLIACRFYFKNGFEIGAVDTMLYSNSTYAGESALFLYSKFNPF